MKSLMGTGIFLTMYSQTTSMLYFSWAEIGITGDPSAMVPVWGVWSLNGGIHGVLMLGILMLGYGCGYVLCKILRYVWGDDR